MANIPVERKAGTPWWLWLLGLLLLLALIFFLIEAFDDEPDGDEVVATDPVETVDPIVTPPVTETALDLSDVYVTRVVSDRAFYVAPGENQTGTETLVILNQDLSPGTPGIEGQVDVNDGQRLNLSAGRMEPIGDENLADLGLSDAEATAVSAGADVVRIDGGAVQVLEAPMGVDDVQVGT